MRRVLTMAAAAVMVAAFASTAFGAIGWAGGIWPVNGASYTSADNIGVYVQVWKDGCTNTDPLAACPDIEAYLYYRCGGTEDAFVEVPMVYNGADVGNNDEFTATIPSGLGCDQIEFYVRVVDTTDNDTWYPQDQNFNNPNFFLTITPVTAQDVVVTFSLCLTEGIDSFFDVCVTGSSDPLTNWGGGVLMMLPCPDVSPKFYQVNVMFPAGSNPYQEYKYKKDDCANWESTGNHSFTIDDSSPVQVLPVDGWEYNTPDCPECMSPVNEESWGAIKGLYR
jgi:hypothetical protein